MSGLLKCSYDFRYIVSSNVGFSRLWTVSFPRYRSGYGSPCLVL